MNNDNVLVLIIVIKIFTVILSYLHISAHMWLFYLWTLLVKCCFEDVITTIFSEKLMLYLGSTVDPSLCCSHDKTYNYGHKQHCVGWMFSWKDWGPGAVYSLQEADTVGCACLHPRIHWGVSWHFSVWCFLWRLIESVDPRNTYFFHSAKTY